MQKQPAFLSGGVCVCVLYVLYGAASTGVSTDGRRPCAGSKLAVAESVNRGGGNPHEIHAPHWWSEWGHVRAPVQPPAAEVPAGERNMLMIG